LGEGRHSRVWSWPGPHAHKPEEAALKARRREGGHCEFGSIKPEKSHTSLGWASPMRNVEFPSG